MLGYSIWRLIFTLDFSTVANGIFSLIFYLLELFGLNATLFFILLFVQKGDNTPPPVSNRDYNPSVDIFITTFNESYKLVMASAMAAKGISYSNKKVYICDDGGRDLLKRYAEEYGINYLRRDNREGGKAGNINNALSASAGNLVLILDADFIVKPEILSDAIAYFQDEKVALVQYPQAFYNKDPFQMQNPKRYNDQDLFMRYIEPLLSKHNATVHIGTNAVIRRSALEEIGCVPTKSITEDVTTGLLMQASGYKTPYVNKVYGLGITPYKLRDIKSQRQRWAKGNLQAHRAYHPLGLEGLSLKQKTIYFEMLMYWLTSFQKILYFLFPTLFMVFSISMIKITAAQIALISLPLLVLFALTFKLFMGKVRSLTESHIYDTLLSPFHAGALIKELFISENKFKVTPKEVEKNNKMDFSPIKFHLFMIAWLIFSLIFSIFQGINGASLPALVICGFWTLYNLYALIYCVLIATRVTPNSAGEALSVEIDENVDYKGHSLKASAMSFDGIIVEKAGSEDIDFVSGEDYEFTVERTGLVVKTKFEGFNKDKMEFIFHDISKEAGHRLSKYYTEKIHAAKEQDFDMPIQF